MPNAELDGVSLYYEFDGDPAAPVLLLSNSLGTSLAMWEQQVKAFARSYRVLRYDMRGHGRSSTPPGPYSIEALAADVVGLLDALGLEAVHFCGLSIGGMIGQFLAVHAPSRLERVVLCNTAAKIGTPDGWSARMASVEQGGMAAIADAVLERWFTQGFRLTHVDVIQRMKAMLLSVDPKGYAATCAAIRDMDQREIVHTISVPVCVLAGEYDEATTPAEGAALHEAIPCSVLKMLPAAHISNIEVPEEFNTAVLDFLVPETMR